MSHPTDTKLPDAMARLAQALEEYTLSTLAIQHAAEEMRAHAGQLARNAEQIKGNFELPPLPAGKTRKQADFPPTDEAALSRRAGAAPTGLCRTDTG